MWNTIELAAEFIRRAAFVDANALLKDDYEFAELARKCNGFMGPVEGLQDV